LVHIKNKTAACAERQRDRERERILEERKGNASEPMIILLIVQVGDK
jgi:hypothetical protein